MKLFKKILNWYVAVIANYPWLCISLVLCASTALILSAALFHDFPSFNDPNVGFQSRGTSLSNRLLTWRKIVKESQPGGSFSLKPIKHAEPDHNLINLSFHAKPHNGDQDQDFGDHFEDEHSHADDVGFCNSPDKDYARFVFIPVDPTDSLYTVQNLLSICSIDSTKLRQSPEFKNSCEMQHKNHCCPSWSIPNYIALFNNKTKCKEIDKADIDNFSSALRNCSAYFQDNLMPDCVLHGIGCQNLPKQCQENNAIFQALYYLVDQDFIHQLSNNLTNRYAILKSTLLFLPIAKSSKTLDYYYALPELRNSHTKIAAMQLGLLDTVFDKFLISDLTYVGLSAIFILISLLIYTQSVLVTFMSLLSILISLGVAYFVYLVIFGIKFFPFINCMAVIICLGIGVDDTFIFSKIWHLSRKKLPKDGPKNEVITEAVSHSFRPMLVTSLTTGIAFYASYASSITTIKCFGLFSGSAIFIQFIVNTLLTPSAFSALSSQGKQLTIFKNFYDLLHIYHQRIFVKLLPKLLSKFRYVFLLLYFTSLLLSAIVIYLYHLDLLPNTTHLQLLETNHPFELYEMKFKKSFSFEAFSSQTSGYPLPIRLVWGVKPENNAKPLDPYDDGKLIHADSFNVSDRKSQEFLSSLCMDVIKQKFFRPSVGLHLSNCFLDTLNLYMDRDCFDTLLQENYVPCCRNSSFPYSPHVFDVCLPASIDDLGRSPATIFDASMPGPRFFSPNSKTAAIVIEYDSIHNFTLQYSKMSAFVTEINAWLAQKLQSAPAGLKDGWFVSDLDFYDLQSNLLYGSLISTIVASITAFILIILVTRSIKLSLISILVIINIISLTISTMILMGWKLGIFQAIITSILVGLSIDFVVHFVISYDQSSALDRETRSFQSILLTASPVTMAFMTTFVAGLFMLLSSVLIYIQIGTFLMIISTWSWISSVFFLQPCMLVFGSFKKIEIQVNELSLMNEVH